MVILEDIERIKHVFDASLNGIIIFDNVGRVLFWNETAGRIFDVVPTEMLGRLIGDFHPEAWPDVQRIIATGSVENGKRVTFRGTTVVTNRSPILEDGRIVGVISIFQDVHEYERIVTKLESYKQLSQELEAIIRCSYDGIYVTDGEGKTLRVNPAYERISGLRAEDLIGRKMNDLIREGILDQSASLEVLRTRKPVTIMQEIIGGKRVMVSAVPVLDSENKEIVFVVGNVRDITELDDLRKELEDHKQLSEKYLSELQELQKALMRENEMIARSKAMGNILTTAIKVARVDTSILISGEAGVGKGLLARLIHNASPRKLKPFIKVICGAIPEHLVETELFGYEKGSFTGASTSGKLGLFEVADGGTIFLDEVGELPLHMQVKLLGILEDRQLTRVGGTASKSIDVRVIAASNQDLKRMVAEKRFREDLYFRLEVIPIHIPPLRERREDVFPLVYHFLKQLNDKFKVRKRISKEAMDILTSYDYPGNVRELKNIVERLVVTSEENVISSEDLPSYILKERYTQPESVPFKERKLKDAVGRIEAQMIRQALKETGNTYKAAEALGINQSTVVRKARKYKILNNVKPH
jgi:PAS domain S-box-containing protein